MAMKATNPSRAIVPMTSGRFTALSGWKADESTGLLVFGGGRADFTGGSGTTIRKRSSNDERMM